MIKSLRIANFRSYKEAFLKFSPGVNVIIGGNDKGKTNIIRAIDLVVNNHPSGDDYISTFGGDLQIDLEVGGKTVTRSRSTKWNKKQNKFVAGDVNIYELSGEKTPFKSFGMNVPDLIKQHLNITPVSIAFQLEGPFLLNKSAADVATHYNNLVHLEIIDTTRGNINSTLRKEQSALKIGKENEKELIQKLKVYDWLDSAEISLVKLEQMRTSIEQLEINKLKLSALIKEHEQLEIIKRKLNTIVQHDKTVIKLQQLNKTIRTLAKDKIDLQELIEEHKKLTEKKRHFTRCIKHESAINSLITQNNTIVTLRSEANVLKHIILQMEQLLTEEKTYASIAKYENEVNRLIKKNKKIVAETKTRDELSSLIKQHEKLDIMHTQLGKHIDRLVQEFKEAMPELCPIFDVQCDYIDNTKKTAHSRRQNG